MSSFPFKTMWLSLSLCDGKGKFVEGFALEVRAVSLFGLNNKDMLLDLVHVDGEQERIRLKAVGGLSGFTDYFRLGTLADYIAGVKMTAEFPANLPISKEEYRRRCGSGKLFDGNSQCAVAAEQARAAI